MRPVFAVDPYQHRNATFQPAQAFKAFLSVGFAGIFLGQHRCTECAGTFRKVNTVFGKVGGAFRFVVSDHNQIILTICENSSKLLI